MTATQPSRGRVVALRVVTASFVLIGLVAANVGLIVPFVAWLPDQRLLDMGTSPTDLGYLVAETAFGFGDVVLLLCLALQVRRPTANVAALWIVITYLGTQMVYDAVRRDIGAPDWYLFYALFLATVVLHPRRVAPARPIDPPGMAVAAIGAIPAVAFAWTQLRQQFVLPVTAENDHFVLALMAAVAVVGAAIAATALPGRRVGVFTATGMSVLVGISSLAHPTAAVFALPQPWAWAAIGWGVAVLVTDSRHLLIRRSAGERLAAASP